MAGSGTRRFLRYLQRKHRKAQRPDMRHVVSAQPEPVPAGRCPVRACNWVGSPRQDRIDRHVMRNHPRSKRYRELTQ